LIPFLLDTNVVAEWVKARPNPGVVAWLERAEEDRIFISVVTLAELRRGIERMAAGGGRKRLDEWLRNQLMLRFDGRVLPVDLVVADSWGRLVARCEASGRPIGAMDAFIAATAEVHRLTLVTHNVTDFETALPAVVNPWNEQ
jgi:toxin FitB